jgi:hypothetical protein
LHPGHHHLSWTKRRVYQLNGSANGEQLRGPLRRSKGGEKLLHIIDKDSENYLS